MCQVLRERIQRKDELLQGYERDLAKLRQAEQLASTKQAQLDSLTVSNTSYAITSPTITNIFKVDNK